MAEATQDFSQSSFPQVNTPEELRDFLENAVQNKTYLYRGLCSDAVSELPIVSLLNNIGVLRELEIFGNLKPEDIFGYHTKLGFLNNRGKKVFFSDPKTPVLISDVSAPILIKVLLDLKPFMLPKYPGNPLYPPLEWLVNTYGKPPLDKGILEKCATESDELCLFANFITPDTLRDYAQNNTVSGDYKIGNIQPHITGHPKAVLDALRKNPSLLDETSFPALEKFFDTALTNHNHYFRETWDYGREWRDGELGDLKKLLSAYTARTTHPAPAAPATPAPM
ncbi:MAG: hypothetical protein JNL76_02080 [Alphaproteobacteria bacterium]|nr:hypothetical protein [Alphaproteobacteria bacterium]